MVGLLFRNRNWPQSLVDLQVGETHLVEVMFHLRRKDWNWYHENEQDLEDELMDVLSTSVIPRMFGDILDDYHDALDPDMNGEAGSKNKKAAAKKAAAPNKTEDNKKRGKKPTLAERALNSSRDDEKDLYFAFGESLQMAYQREAMPEDIQYTFLVIN